MLYNLKIDNFSLMIYGRVQLLRECGYVIASYPHVFMFVILIHSFVGKNILTYSVCCMSNSFPS